MIKIRLLKTKTNDYFQLLDEAVIPDIESVNDINIIVYTAGTLLKPYAESLQDPNLVSVALDKSITDWTIMDLESMQELLLRSNLQLAITKEDGEDLRMTSAQIKYILIDSTQKFLGVLPYSYTQVIDKTAAVDNIEIINVIYNFMSRYSYFDSKKFTQNPLNTLLEQLSEGKKLLGTLNSSAMIRLMRLLRSLNKELIVISLT